MIMEFIKFGVLLVLLIYASVKDVKTRDVPDFIWIMIMILGLCGIGAEDLPSMIAGGVSAFMPVYISAYLNHEKPVGGADIKISGAAGFLLGIPRCMYALITGMASALILVFINAKIRKKTLDLSFPLVPFISAGIVASYFI